MTGRFSFVLALALFLSACDDRPLPNRIVEIDGQRLNWCWDLSRAQRAYYREHAWDAKYLNSNISGQMMCFDELYGGTNI